MMMNGVVVVVVMDHLNNRLPDFKFLQRHMQKQTYADSENSTKYVILSNITYTPLAESGLQTW
jgi:hypothetical protein